MLSLSSTAHSKARQQMQRGGTGRARRHDRGRSAAHHVHQFHAAAMCQQADSGRSTSTVVWVLNGTMGRSETYCSHVVWPGVPCGRSTVRLTCTLTAAAVWYVIILNHVTITVTVPVIAAV